MAHKSRGIMALQGVLLIPLCTLVVAAGGALYGMLTAVNPHALLNIIAYPFLIFGLGCTVVGTMRLSVLRSSLVALPIGIIFTVAFLAATVYGALVVAPPPSTGAAHTFWSYLGERRQTGLTLVAGYVPIKGWLLIILWVAGGALAAFGLVIPCLAEADRPFCQNCRSWAWRTRWRFTVRNPQEGALAELQQEKNLSALLNLRPDAVRHLAAQGKTKAKRVEVKLGACNCGRMATIAANLIRINVKDEKSTDWIMADIPAPRQTREKLFQWAESIDPSMQSRRPKLGTAPAQPSGEPFDIDPQPAEGEHISKMRWTAPLGASDSYCDNSYTRELRRRLSQGDYDLVDQALRDQKHPEDFAVVAEACADWEGRPQWMEDWEIADPDSPSLLLVRGINSVKLGWQARGGDWVPKNYAQFQMHLREAMQDLHAAAAAAPDDPTSWAWMIYAAKGLQEGQDVIKSLLAEAHKRSPFHRPAYSFALDAFAGKWGGSDERMLQLARRIQSAAPAGNHVLVLIPEAHVELARTAWRENGKQAGADYWNSPAIADELRRANEKCFRKGAHRPTMDTPRTRAFFAYALWKAGATEYAAEHLKIIGKSSPWAPFSPNIPFMKDSVRKARKACGVA